MAASFASVAVLRAPEPPDIRAFSSVEAACACLDRDRPIPVFYPHALDTAVATFAHAVPGEMMYAVKCNPHRSVLRALHEAGCRRFDVASIAEIDAVQSVVPGAPMAFMHPVKSRSAIRHALAVGIDTFALDSGDELVKINQEVGSVSGLTLMIRLTVAGQDAAFALTDKFGATPEEAAGLMRRAADLGARVGLTFHVGSQCLRPDAYKEAIALAARVTAAAGVGLDVLDVGGGFPVSYPGMTPPPMAEYGAAIADAVAAHGLTGVALFSEPGRALVAESGSMLVKVELRKGDRLYLNDGTYGALFDAGRLVRWPFPVRRVGYGGSQTLQPFSFYGPTCDSLDSMDGPFHLPQDMAEGDWIEIGHLGAYGLAMRTQFNGFGAEELVAIDPAAARPSLSIAAE
ncbi:MAG: type III PLP-dependent enzyme [Rhodothalassiaceae bacterium]